MAGICWASALVGEHQPAGKQAAVVCADSHIHEDWRLLNVKLVFHVSCAVSHVVLKQHLGGNLDFSSPELCGTRALRHASPCGVRPYRRLCRSLGR